MFTPQKIATVTGLVGSLAVICVGAAHAHADGPKGDCRTTAQGDTVCVRKSEVRIDKRGKHILKQAQDCAVIDRPRVVGPDDDLLAGGAKNVGPVVECDNVVKVPKGFKGFKGFKKPHIRF
ncbi:hypothetical protein [Streptomyces alanosinicus]|uniref:Secreted protein n=1 Tax=Streptomyces alanosinicus TaxID=68171 RepID=A0A919D1T4_9ACTN|nr:hypothetical protein [Streptomyces alanosinicus]GHD99113.1 hypothetical protein GCM10010339_08980 [Streptomyces alanosinicus]